MIKLLEVIYYTFRDIAPYLFIGLAFAGLLNIFFKKDLIAKHLGKGNFLSVIKAALLGVPLPLCSCGVIPTALYLRKEKASRGATLSFLISTPQTGVDSIIATYGMMGPIFAIFRPLAAFITGIIGGIMANYFFKDEKKNAVPKGDNYTSCSIAPPSTNFFSKIKNMIRYAFVDFLDDISIQLTIGIILAGIISYVIPDNFFANYGGDGIGGMLIMILIGIPLYVCATGSIPIAMSLIAKGISPGAAFVFLVAGPATNAATITLIANSMGKKVVAIYLSVISVFAILGGFALNYIFKITKTPLNFSAMSHTKEFTPLLLILTLLFSLALALSLFRKLKGKFIKIKSEEIKMNSNEKLIGIEGMTCNHCVAHVTKAIQAVSGVEKAAVNLNAKNAIITGDFAMDSVIKAVEEAGYKVV